MPPLTTLSETGLNDDNVTFAANQSQVARLDTQHGAIHSAMPHLVLAPIDLAAGGHRILDHPTLTYPGIWAARRAHRSRRKQRQHVDGNRY
jgi:hypothetical protein